MKLIFSISHIKSSIELSFSEKIHIIRIGKNITINKIEVKGKPVRKIRSKTKVKSNSYCAKEIGLNKTIDKHITTKVGTLKRPTNSLIYTKIRENLVV